MFKSVDVHHGKSAVLEGNTFLKNWGWLQLTGLNYLGLGLTILWDSIPDSFVLLERESVGLLAFLLKEHRAAGNFMAAGCLLGTGVTVTKGRVRALV